MPPCLDSIAGTAATSGHIVTLTIELERTLTMGLERNIGPSGTWRIRTTLQRDLLTDWG